MAAEIREQEYKRLTELTSALTAGLKSVVPGLEINGQGAPRHPGIVSCRFPGISAEEMVVRLDGKGICVSPGAACSARDGKPSHVLLSMGLTQQQAARSVRFSPGRLTTMEEIEETIRAVAEICR